MLLFNANVKDIDIEIKYIKASLYTYIFISPNVTALT